jgi:hypothetical protein
VNESVGPPVPGTARLEGWIEPSQVDNGWSFKVEAYKDTDVQLVLETLEGVPVLQFHDGPLTRGHHEFRWNGRGPVGDALEPRTLQIHITAIGVDRTYLLRLLEGGQSNEPTKPASPAPTGGSNLQNTN